MASPAPSLQPAPVLARLSGLPVDVLEEFSTDLCENLPDRPAMEAELESARAELVDRLHAAVPSASSEARRVLLSVKRDAHNGRSVARHRSGPAWDVVRAAAGSAADRFAAAEDRLAGAEAEFRLAYEAARDGQRTALVRHFGNRSFMRGLALSSPDLLRARGRLEGTPPSQRTRRDQRAEEALLRYVSRAAVKISPFSTFTPFTLGELRGDLAPGELRLEGGGWRQRSLLRLKRYLLHQHVDALRRHPGFRGSLPVLLNSSAAEIEPGRFLYLCPSHWKMDEARERWIYVRDTLMTVSPRSPVVPRLTELLNEGPRTYAELVGALDAESGGAPSAATAVDRLLGVGFLQFGTPWPANAGHMEKHMLRHLRTLAAPELEPFADALERLLEVEQGFVSSSDPAAEVGRMEEMIGELWRTSAVAGGMDAETRYDRPTEQNFYEDVFLRPEPGDDGEAAVVGFSVATAEALVRQAEPLVRLTWLFDHRHELHHALAALAAERWPGRREVGVLELLQAAQSLFRDYIGFRIAVRMTERWAETWNPMALAEAEELDRWRRVVLDGLPGCLVREGDDERLLGDRVSALLDRVPARYTTPQAGAALLLQPASADGSLWMMNRLKEGTGRYASRFAMAMDPRSRERFTAHLAARGTFEMDGETVEYLDVQCIQGDTMNVHGVQTPAVLALPGAEAHVAEHRRVTLRDLRVSFDGPDGTSRLRGRDGRRYVALHLGQAFEDCMPPLVKFLAVWGPSESNTVLPAPSRHDVDGISVTRRTLLGDMVIRRRSWSVPVPVVAPLLEGGDEAAAFAAFNRWRMERGIPEHVFVFEKRPLPIPGEFFKPQYLDFGSPLFVGLFRGAAAAGVAALSLVEMLPQASHFPADRDGARWAVELLVDSLAMRPAHVRAAEPEPVRAPGRRMPAAVAGG